MALSVSVIPGYQFANQEKVTYPSLNLLGQPTFTLSGTVETSDLANGAVTAAKSTPGNYWYAVGSLAAGVYSVDLDPSLASYVEGTIVRFRAGSDNTGAVDINVDSKGDKNLYRDHDQELRAGDIRAGMVVEAVYDSAGNFQIISPLADFAHWHTTSVSGTDNYIITMTPTLKSYYDGLVISFEVPNTNTGSVQVNVDSLGLKSLLKNFDEPMVAGDLREGQVVRAVYNLTTDTFQMISHLGNAYPDQAVMAGDNLGLVIKSNVANPNIRVDILGTGAQVVVTDSDTGISRMVDNFGTLVVDISSSGGPNLLDTGSAANDTWYYIWLIYDGTTVAGLFSTSKTSPVLPTGYSYKALIGAIRRTTADFIEIYQIGRRVWIEPQQVFAARNGVTSWTAISADSGEHNVVKRSVPDIAKIAHLIGSSVESDAHAGMAVAGNSSGTLGYSIHYAKTTGVNWDPDSGDVKLAFELTTPLITAQDFYWKTDDAGPHFKLQIVGWIF